MSEPIYKKISDSVELAIIHHPEPKDKNGKTIAPCDEVIIKIIKTNKSTGEN